ncbi:MAG: hypothetical protein GKS01_05620 [Alphaproteobacteria bacterium]|nr:hypothetical protein [Alphaproteobacteria bacterium]
MATSTQIDDPTQMNNNPSSRIFFATFVEPGKKHFLELNAFVDDQTGNAISNNEVIVRYFDVQGALVATDEVADHSVLYPLRTDLESRCLVLIDTPFRKQIPSIYGYAVGQDDQGGTFYPVNAAIGYPEVSVWLNRAVVPIGPQISGSRRELFLANVSRWAPLRIRIRFHGGEQIVTAKISLRPKCHMFMHVEETAAQHGLEGEVEAISVVSNNKPMVYILGRSHETGDLGFIEHLMSVPRRNPQLPRAKRPQIEPELETEFLETTVCWCNAVKTRQVINGEIPAHAGDYCTACRDDLRLLSRTIKQEPAIAKNLDRLEVALSNAAKTDS